MISLKSKYFIFLLSSLFIFNISKAQEDFESGFNFGVSIGGSRLLGEMNGFSETIKEFNNHFGIATSFEISKFMTPHLEVGLGFGYSNITGDLEDPLTLSAQGLHAAFPLPPNQVVDPLQYNNKLIKPNLHVSYYISSVSRKSSFTPFIKASVGYLTYKSQLKYSETGELIFGKGEENTANLSTGSYDLGFGFKTTITPQVFLNTSFDFSFVNYDLLDVVHNYDDEGNRIEVVGVYYEFKIGIFYTTKVATGGQNSSGNKKKSGKNNKTNSNSHLPFAR